MVNFLTWYLVITLLGWLSFPLAWRLLPALADRGYAFSRALGLLLWGFIFWMLASLGVIQNDSGGLALAFFIVISLSAWVVWTADRGRQPMEKDTVHRPPSIVAWLRSNLRLIITTEALFLLAFAAWTVVRAANPEITSAGGEKTMELAFINAIMRSPTFPPHDPWLSGYAISYYYFGYVMAAMLAEVTGVAGSVAHNLMLALVFALSAVGAYGILYNLLAVWKTAKEKKQATEDSSSVVHRPFLGLPLLGPFFLLIVSNLEGFLEVLHARGIFWPARPGAWNFWIWLDIKFLDQLPTRLGWIPDRFWWWWQASRVIQDVDLAGARAEIIDEFPFFSYLLGDLHPHVLAMPFVMLAIAMALNIFLGGWDGENNLLGFRLPLQWKGLFFATFVLGGLAFLNTWDILAFTALVLGAFLLRRVRVRGWTWVRLEELITLAIPLGVSSLLLYLPFYIGFSSQAGGVLPNLVSPTRGIHLWVMFGSLFIPIFAYLIYLRRGEKESPRWLAGFGLSAGIVLLLWLFSWLLGIAAWFKENKFASDYIQSQGASTPGQFFLQATQVRLTSSGGLLVLFALLGFAFAYLLRREDKDQDVEESLPASRPSSFVILLISLAGLLVLAPEFVFVRDTFGNRMNTVFKFYYQGWEMWSLAGAFGVAVMLQDLRRVWAWAFRIGLGIVLVMALTYSVLGLLAKTNNFKPAYGWTLDGAVQFERDYPSDALAVKWLQSAPSGVVAEAVINLYYFSYQDYAHISTYSGLPTVLGWGGHELQWRGSFDGLKPRADDIRTLYETNNWEEARAILEKYNIRYVYVGTLERSTYKVSETKFQQNMQAVYQGGGVAIYAIP
jgi:YYY domain-containing protein